VGAEPLRSSEEAAAAQSPLSSGALTSEAGEHVSHMDFSVIYSSAPSLCEELCLPVPFAFARKVLGPARLAHVPLRL